MPNSKLNLTDRDVCTIREAITISLDNKDFYNGDMLFQSHLPGAIKLSRKLDSATRVTLNYNDLTAVMFVLAVAIDVLRSMKADGTDYLPIDEVLLTDCISLDDRLARYLDLQ